MTGKRKGWGEWAFIVGVILALAAALASSLVTKFMSETTVVMVLMVLGVIVGLLNIQGKETPNFLLATIALMAIGAGGLDKLAGSLGKYLGAVVQYIAVFVAPAAFIVALKAIFDMAKK